MTVGALLRTVSAVELTEWMMLYRIEAEEREAAEKAPQPGTDEALQSELRAKSKRGLTLQQQQKKRRR